jgi:hypothetical protein
VPAPAAAAARRSYCRASDRLNSVGWYAAGIDRPTSTLFAGSHPPMGRTLTGGSDSRTAGWAHQDVRLTGSLRAPAKAWSRLPLDFLAQHGQPGVLVAQPNTPSRKPAASRTRAVNRMNRSTIISCPPPASKASASVSVEVHLVQAARLVPGLVAHADAVLTVTGRLRLTVRSSDGCRAAAPGRHPCRCHGRIVPAAAGRAQPEQRGRAKPRVPPPRAARP